VLTWQDGHGLITVAYFYGHECPVGGEACKSYKKKMNCCRSYACREFSMNYLARHLQNAHGVANKRDAFVQAAEYRQEEEEITREQRAEYRMHTAEVANYRLGEQRGSAEATSSSSKRRRLDDPALAPAHAPAVLRSDNAELMQFLSNSGEQSRRFAEQARVFAADADHFAEMVEETRKRLSEDMLLR
jgi:hypothetical protein